MTSCLPRYRLKEPVARAERGCEGLNMDWTEIQTNLSAEYQKMKTEEERGNREMKIRSL